MKAFITGATGFLGRHLIDELLAHGYEVNALVRTFDRARSLPSGVQTTPGDITKPATMRPGMRGAGVVFHVGAVYRVGLNARESERMVQTNVEGTRATLELAGELGVRRIVYTSSVAVFGHTGGRLVEESYRPAGTAFDSEYERSKYLAHYEVAVPLQHKGLPIIIVCPGVIYGPGDTSPMATLLRLYARRRLPIMMGGESAYTWVHVDDVAAGHRLAAEKGRPGETYVITGPALNYRQFFEAAERGTGLPAPRLWLPSGLAGALARGLRALSPGMAETLRNFAGVSYLATAEKARRELSWSARPVEAGMPETVAWLRSP